MLNSILENELTLLYSFEEKIKVLKPKEEYLTMLIPHLVKHKININGSDTIDITSKINSNENELETVKSGGFLGNVLGFVSNSSIMQKTVKKQINSILLDGVLMILNRNEKMFLSVLNKSFIELNINLFDEIEEIETNELIKLLTEIM